MSYIKYFTVTALLILLSFLGLGYFFQPLSGDLTRLGGFSERDFGWNARQPQISVKGQPDETKPTVIVLGDSFSDGNYWQSVVMEKSSFKILTFKWDGLDNPNNCLESWIGSLHRSYPTVKYIIVEAVERSFIDRFEAQQLFCQNKRQKPVEIEKRTTPSVRDNNLQHAIPDPIYAIRAAINSLKSFDKPSISGDTFITPLNRSDLFSNRKSELLIYYKDDYDKKDWKPDELRKAVSNIKHMQLVASKSGITFIMAVVPDKLTAYYKFVKYPLFHQSPPDVWKELDKQEITQANLCDTMISSASSTQDLYLPNDTHLGTKGFALMGDVLLRRLKEIEASSH